MIDHDKDIITLVSVLVFITSSYIFHISIFHVIGKYLSLADFEC